MIYGQAGRLLAAPFDLSRLELTGPAVPVLDDVRMDLWPTGRVFVDVAASGSLVYVPGAPRPGERTLVWIDRRGDATPAMGEKRAYKGARLSPDGHGRGDDDRGPADQPLELRPRTRHVEPADVRQDVSTPAWTPDGARLLYPPSAERATRHLSDRRGRRRQARAADAAVDARRRHARRRARAAGLALFSVQNSAGDDIHSLSLDAPHTIAPFQADAANEASPAFSPSGRYVAYSSTESGRREVYIRPFAGPVAHVARLHRRRRHASMASRRA